MKLFQIPYTFMRMLAKERQRRRKELREHILWHMQIPYSNPEKLRNIEKIFRQNPDLKLHRYLPFRAWYKHYMGSYLENPDFYAKLIAAGMTPLDQDPYFDPNAPDWEQFDQEHYYDDDDDDD